MLASYAWQMCSGLAYLHYHYIVHRAGWLFLGMREGGVVGVWCVSLKWLGQKKKPCAEARVVGGVCGPLHHS